MIDSRIVDAFNAQHDFPLQSSLIMLGYVGSTSHGTYVPPDDPQAIDDVDMMGVIIPPLRYTLGTQTFEHWTFAFEELDVVCYSFDKMARLLIKANPNVLSTLWLNDEHYLVNSEAWRRFQAQRRLFSTLAASHSFAGYAAGQLHKMTSYSPEIEREMHTLETELEAAGWHLQDVMDKRSVPMPKGLSPNEANNKAQRLRSLRAKFHAAYMGEKRRGLVVKHGYDTKNAAHLVRLLRMCIEFLGHGELRVDRSAIDAETLREIKRGEWSLERVQQHAEELFTATHTARDASPLPLRPDERAIAELVSDVHLAFYNLGASV